MSPSDVLCITRHALEDLRARAVSDFGSGGAVAALFEDLERSMTAAPTAPAAARCSDASTMVESVTGLSVARSTLRHAKAAHSLSKFSGCFGRQASTIQAMATDLLGVLAATATPEKSLEAWILGLSQPTTAVLSETVVSWKRLESAQLLSPASNAVLGALTRSQQLPRKQRLKEQAAPSQPQPSPRDAAVARPRGNSLEAIFLCRRCRRDGRSRSSSECDSATQQPPPPPPLPSPRSLVQQPPMPPRPPAADHGSGQLPVLPAGSGGATIHRTGLMAGLPTPRPRRWESSESLGPRHRPHVPATEQLFITARPFVSVSTRM